jgi:hypothetical protein
MNEQNESNGRSDMNDMNGENETNETNPMRELDRMNSGTRYVEPQRAPGTQPIQIDWGKISSACQAKLAVNTLNGTHGGSDAETISHCTRIDIGSAIISYDNCSPDYNLLETAKEYAALGWKVLPIYGPIGVQCSCSGASCGCIGKHPITSDGLKSATLDQEQLEVWWKTLHHLNIGVATGADSGIFVLDIDVKGDKRGDISIEYLEAQHGSLPETVEAITGCGGRHLIFMHPGFPISNKQDGKCLGAGIDVRGDGGYIVAPGSKYKSGTEYRWKEGHSPQDLSPPDAPNWVLEWLTRFAVR